MSSWRAVAHHVQSFWTISTIRAAREGGTKTKSKVWLVLDLEQ
jgi:hypothetical protein